MASIRAGAVSGRRLSCGPRSLANSSSRAPRLSACYPHKAVQSFKRGDTVAATGCSRAVAGPKRLWRLKTRSTVDRVQEYTTATGDGDGGSGHNGGYGDYGGSGNGDGDSRGPEGSNVELLLAASGKALENLPRDMREAYLQGRLAVAVLARYLTLDQNPIFSYFMGFTPLRERLLGDSSFFTKVAIEVGIGMCAKITAERTKRGKHFEKEMDFVVANVIMALVADFMLVFLPAPTLSLRTKNVTQNAVSKFLATCPDNAFQKVPLGYDAFSLAQRVGAVLRNGALLTCVGFGSSIVGVGVTNSIGKLRKLLDPTFEEAKAQDVVTTSAAYGSYMATSANLRYQLVAGVFEERGIEVLCKGNPQLCTALSFILRTCNTYVGSLLWVDYIRLLGIQKRTDDDAKPALA